MLTPQTHEENLANAMGVSDIYLKREDLHPYGSHKGRSIPVMIDHYRKQGFLNFAVSSSGNAAISASMHITKLANDGEKVTLEIFVGQKINSDKKMALEKFATNYIKINQTERPLQALAKLLASDDSVKSLRQSKDNVALTGYHTLAEELLAIDNLEAVFIATSSGTTAEALHQYFKEKSKKIKIFIVQTTSCHPMTEEFDEPETSEQSLADAIVDITAERKIQVIEAIKESGGKGLTVSNDEIRSAQELLSKYSKIEATANGALSFAGLLGALKKGQKFKGAVCCIISGK